MSGLRVGALAALLAASASAGAGAQTRVPRGAMVRVQRTGVLVDLRGELIAASSDTVWVLEGSQLVSIPAPVVWRVLVKRRPIGARGVAIWGLVGGVASGLGLTVACASYTDGCGGVLPGVLVLWAGWTAVWAAVAGSEYSDYYSNEFETRLKSFARFPQGLPPSLDPSSLVRGWPPSSKGR